MNRRSFLTRILAAAVAAPAMDKIVAGAAVAKAPPPQGEIMHSNFFTWEPVSFDPPPFSGIIEG